MLPRSTPRTTVYCLFAVMVGGLVLSSVTPAHATDEPPVVPLDPPATVEVFWLMPNGGTAENVTYPQTYLPAGESSLLPGECAQVDTYLVSEAATFYADGILNLGEDYGNGNQSGAISWRFVCAPVVVPPVEPPVTVDPPVIDPPVVVEPPVDVQLPTISSAYVEPVLAHTGPTDLWLFLVAGGALAAGVLFLVYVSRKRVGA